ncbi:hypothetical protein [Mesorhizobium sp. M0578]|uniref:hypothetical protein n=1 Tax=unclassified Mesorhizobium TaxID=325217 RepID=UPI003336111D
MHKVLKAFPCSFDGIKAEPLNVGDERDFGSMAEGLTQAGLIGELDAKPNGGVALRDDGPTVTEYVAAGYSASQYPPHGYASRSTAEEIAEAAKAEAAKAKADEKAAKAAAKAEAEKAKMRDAILADLMKLSDEDLAKVVEAEKIAVVDGDSRDVVLGKIADARMAAQG